MSSSIFLASSIPIPLSVRKAAHPRAFCTCTYKPAMVLLSPGGAMAAYSRDLRQRVVHAYDSGMTAAAVAARFEVSVAWVYRLVQRRRETGSIAPRTQTIFRRRSLSSDQEVRLVALITARPDATL